MYTCICRLTLVSIHTWVPVLYIRVCACISTASNPMGDYKVYSPTTHTQTQLSLFTVLRMVYSRLYHRRCTCIHLCILMQTHLYVSMVLNTDTNQTDMGLMWSGHVAILNGDRFKSVRFDIRPSVGNAHADYLCTTMCYSRFTAFGFVDTPASHCLPVNIDYSCLLGPDLSSVK